MSSEKDMIRMLLERQADNVSRANEDIRKKSIAKSESKKIGLPSWYHLNKYGEQVMTELKGLVEDKIPTMLIGGTGMGKTVMLQAIAKELGREDVGFNCYTGMDIQPLIGIWRPQGDGTVTWQDGVLTQGIRNGAIIRIEEYTRANPELKSRLFGILDSQNRSWNMIEAGIDNIDIHEDTTIVASANPTGSGYVGTMREDRASMSRFGAVMEIYEPLADEQKALMSTLNDKNAVERIMRFAELVRKDKATYVSTRDLHFLALAFKRGIDPQRAMYMVLTPKYEGHQDSIITHARAVFESFDGVEVEKAVNETIGD